MEQAISQLSGAMTKLKEKETQVLLYLLDAILTSEDDVVEHRSIERYKNFCEGLARITNANIAK
jgi:hypothetical protein